jgi:alkanesulfonate monooxygenase SsuD/methylene tetrahydromethanopterin reductase-like flavin-dependent oxidoreductase (luciferase family)
VTANHPRPVAAQRAWGLEKPSLGISLGGAHAPDQLERHREWVRRAESLELHSVWLPEMHFAPGVCPTPLIELAGHAAATRTLRLGTTSLLLPLHPPESLASEIATLDRLSGGRLLLGLGRGFQPRMLAAFRVPPAEKRDRFDEALDRMLALWAEGNDASSALATWQKPHPPLAVAAFGPKGLAQAARRGLPYLASPVETLQQIEANQLRHRSGLSDTGVRALSIVMRTVFVSENADECADAREALTREFAGRRPGMPAAIHQALDAPLDERAVIGNAAQVRTRLAEIRNRLDFDLLIVRPQIGGLASSSLERSLERLAMEIWPGLEDESRDT